jgi:hypothetical protein
MMCRCENLQMCRFDPPALRLCPEQFSDFQLAYSNDSRLKLYLAMMASAHLQIFTSAHNTWT